MDPRGSLVGLAPFGRRRPRRLRRGGVVREHDLTTFALGVAALAALLLAVALAP